MAARHRRAAESEAAMPTAHLSREHARTLDAIFQHPVSHNLEWRHLMSLLETIGTVTEGHDRAYHITLNGQTHAMQQQPPHKDLADVGELVALRHFLARTGVVPSEPHQQGDPGDDTSSHVGSD
jgi:hypothetical protein